MTTIRTDLGDGWQLRLADASDPAVPTHVRAALPIPATVPGTVHTDLLAAGLIPDPYLDENELTLDWIGRVSWVYERVLPSDSTEEAILLFEGLDTVCTVSVNDVVVATMANMHRRYEVPAELHKGDNILAVQFDSAWAYGEAERERIGRVPNQYPGPFNYLRKMACNFGWDWGPTLVTAGIWRPVTLIQPAGPRILSVRPTVTLFGAHGRVAFDVRLSGPASVTASVGSISKVSEKADHVVVDVDVPSPALWWPRGLGEQFLYDASVEIDGDRWDDRIGFRSVRLDTTPDDEGTPFAIVVNDVPVPIRGANWIPDDCFLPRVTVERLRTRIGQAADANVNLLRVWGGGVYESRDFYRTCDEQGVLVWQDFLFACAAYPEDAKLADEIDAEARDNVARLMPHPSLVLWNGNNENIWGYVDWNWQAELGGRPWGLGYYLDRLPKAVAETDPSRPYWPGSPYSGSMDIHPNDDDHALKHVWDVWNAEDYPVYRRHRPRFVAEFGWQAPPTWSTLTRAVHDEPLSPTSPGMLHHQKAGNGNEKLSRWLAAHFPPISDFDDWHFATQLNQARAISLGVEYYRSLRPRCTGAIVWQLNDCWPVTSWSAVDGDGRKKPLWYALRNAFAPRLLTIQPLDGGLELVAVNDTGETWRGPVTVRRLTFAGKVLAEFTARVVTDRLGVARLALPPSLTVPSTPASEVLVAETAHERALWFFAPDKELAYEPDALDTHVTRDEDGVVSLRMTAETLVRDLCVFADRVDADASADECLVTLLPGEERTLLFYGIPDGHESDLLAPKVLRTANDLVARGNQIPG